MPLDRFWFVYKNIGNVQICLFYTIFCEIADIAVTQEEPETPYFLYMPLDLNGNITALLQH